MQGAGRTRCETHPYSSFCHFLIEYFFSCANGACLDNALLMFVRINYGLKPNVPDCPPWPWFQAFPGMINPSFPPGNEV